MYVIKRNGTKEDYNREKIFNAIKGANNSCSYQITDEKINNVVDSVENNIYPDITVENIQDIVEQKLMEHNYFEMAKKYIMYRYKHMLRRESSKKLTEIYKDILFSDAENADFKRENANINTNAPMGQMLKLGTEGAKMFISEMLPEEMLKAHSEKFLHFHDLDFSLITLNCCQIDLLKLFKNGFSTGHGYLREPKSIRSYSALSCIGVQSNQNDCLGGQSINCFDYAMAEGVKKSFLSALVNHALIYSKYNNLNFSPDFLKEKFKDVKYLENKSSVIYDNNIEIISKLFNDADKIYELACLQVEEETHQAMEAAVHNFCSLHSRAGSQTPFSSINFGTDTSPEGRLVIRELLKAIENGLGNHETPIFPISIFRILKGVNYYEDDPNYDLFKYACKVSAKRLYPNFLNCSASYNLKYYKPGNYNTLAATMGCVDGEEIVIYKIFNIVYCESIRRMYERLSSEFEIKTSGLSKYMELEDVQVMDGHEFVKVKKIMKNPDMSNWVSVSFKNVRSLLVTYDHPLYTTEGRKLVKDLTLEDSIVTYYNQTAQNNRDLNISLAYLLGLISVAGDFSRDRIFISINSFKENELINVIPDLVMDAFNRNIHMSWIQNNYRDFTEISVNDSSFFATLFRNMLGGDKLTNIQIPASLFGMSYDIKCAFVAGIIDGKGTICKKGHKVGFNTTNKELNLQLIALVQSLGVKANYSIKRINDCFRYHDEFEITSDIKRYMHSSKKKLLYISKKVEIKKKPIRISNIKYLGFLNKYSYDLETESDKFSLSFINSGNCRTRVISNVNGPEETGGRGNFAFVTVNLPKLALEASGDIEKFYELYDKYIGIAHDYILYRLQIIADKHVYNFPFLMGQGVWMGSENLKETDTIRDVLKHATYSIGVCGLAECLVALTGKHHGESEESQKLGLAIIDHLRQRMDEYTKKEKMNWSAFATPAESTAGTFQKANREKYGVIPGVTDRPYMTNSSHVPVYYPINAIDKIKIESPYHEKFNAGQILYIEYPGDPADNVEAFEKLIKTMCEYDASYLAINHPVDRDPICGYTGIIKNECPHCKRKESGEWKHIHI